jgi:hypothetical protein
MGATDIQVMKIGKFKNVGQAYREAQNDADDEYGHQQGHSGEINSTDSISKAVGHPRFGSAIFYKWAERAIEDRDRGDLLYIELTKSQIKKYQSVSTKGERGIRGYVFFGWARSYVKRL